MNEDQFFLICFMIFLLWMFTMGVIDLFRSRKKKYLVTLSFWQPYDYTVTFEVKARGKIDAERLAISEAMYKHHIGYRSIKVISIKRKE
ncbi:hypothetical protein [Enterococcus wangshanyuanii]|uniref:Uncharacterized protein n=1 Tax=Enterococcus wangshanyuanii TaxID=2005703 RepID=A0ABQ1PWY9_9ENTE|nr:hypothetical protein [Enterococcus wangshanyuanii]GGD06195.1 hypothetical protein GCM10011573_39510 [Enterococcus wangshanyuanii]